MNGVDVVVDIAKESLYTVISVALPVLLVSLIVGLIVSIFQTVTSIQEQTLTFVPKIVAVFITLVVLAEYGLIHCTADELQSLPSDAVKYKKENTYGVEAMVLRNAVPSSIHVSPISIEELFVFMVKEAK